MEGLSPATTPSLVLAYRFALLLTGEADRAARLLHETLRLDGGRFEEIREVHRSAWLAARVRERCQSLEPAPEGTEWNGLPGGDPLGGSDLGRILKAFAGLEEVERSALGLFYTGGFSPEEIRKVLGLELEGLGAVLFSARDGLRAALEGGVRREQVRVSEREAHLACHYPGWSLPRAVQKMEVAAARDLLLAERLRVQNAEDGRWMAVVALVELPPGLDGWEGEPEAVGGKRWAHPAVLSVLAGVVILAGFLGWQWMDGRSDFQGRGTVVDLVVAARGMSGNEMQPTQLRVGELADALYMRGFEGYRVGADLAGQRAVGSRVFRVRGVPVAQVAVDAHSALLYVFREADLGVRVPGSGGWRILECGELTAAVRGEEGVCSVVSIRGSRADMDAFLKTLKP